MIWAKILGPIFASVFLFVVGYNIGGSHATNRVEAKYNKKIIEAAEAASRVLNIKDGELEQCRAEVTKYNEATAASAAKIQRTLAADKAERARAEQRALARQQQSEKRLEAAFSTLDELRRLIDEGAFQGCAVEHVGTDIVGMLNDALAAADNGQERDGDLP